MNECCTASVVWCGGLTAGHRCPAACDAVSGGGKWADKA